MVKKPILRPLEAKCFYQCDKVFEVKYNWGRKEYVKRNNWGYWTENEADKDKYVCNGCLRKIYQDKYFFWEHIQNEKKRKVFRAYANNGLSKKKTQCDGVGCDEYSCCLDCKCCVRKSKLLAKLAKKKLFREFF